MNGMVMLRAVFCAALIAGSTATAAPLVTVDVLSDRTNAVYACGAPAKIEVAQDRADALYRAGEEAVFTVAVKENKRLSLTAFFKI